MIVVALTTNSIIYDIPRTKNLLNKCYQIIINRYDDWLNGQDYGRHPEEPNAKLTPANPPTAEEFMVNNRNKDKEIPLCLLEPKNKKKRRHPIHKNKTHGKFRL